MNNPKCLAIKLNFCPVTRDDDFAVIEYFYILVSYSFSSRTSICPGQLVTARRRHKRISCRVYEVIRGRIMFASPSKA